MATAKPVVFVSEDDLWVPESLQTLIHDEGWQPETFASAQEVALKASRDNFLTASDN
jgi:FixJ family two-component response regulator